jgi:hypothetical protein
MSQPNFAGPRVLALKLDLWGGGDGPELERIFINKKLFFIEKKSSLYTLLKLYNSSS